MRNDHNRITAADYIEEIQRGRTGIYPYRLAQDVAARFEVPMVDAQALVLEHMRREITAAVGAEGDARN